MKFRYKPVEVMALQWNGPEDNSKLARFAGHWANIQTTERVYITTPMGGVLLERGDWVVRAVGGEAYARWKPDQFAARFEPA